MTHYITADHLVDTATKAVTEELFREFDKALQSFCNEERDRIVVFEPCVIPESACTFCGDTCPKKIHHHTTRKTVSWR